MEHFFFNDFGAEDIDRFFNFATLKNIEILSNAKLIVIDGTFKTAPLLFKQIKKIFFCFYKNTLFFMLKNVYKSFMFKFDKKIIKNFKNI